MGRLLLGHNDDSLGYAGQDLFVSPQGGRIRQWPTMGLDPHNLFTDNRPDLLLGNRGVAR